jgi:hypothetical protein
MRSVHFKLYIGSHLALLSATRPRAWLSDGFDRLSEGTNGSFPMRPMHFKLYIASHMGLHNTTRPRAWLSSGYRPQPFPGCADERVPTPSLC